MRRTSFSFFALLSLSLSVGILGLGCDQPTTPVVGFDTGTRPDAGYDANVDGGDRCQNGAMDGEESDVDCGGGCDNTCADGRSCNDGADCENGVCASGSCQAPTCTDGVRNGAEVGVDCGPTCGLCGAGQPCTTHAECSSGVCRGGTCAEATCFDMVFNGAETALDCGGPECAGCAVGRACTEHGDCASNFCLAMVCTTPTCTDGIRNQDETDLDCGGVRCPACGSDLECVVNDDCMSGQCYMGICVSCSDASQNGSETDVDCGGACAPCADQRMCLGNEDCTSANCTDGLCISCGDGVRNQDETDADCGGSTCTTRCAPMQRCAGNSDCASDICDATTMLCNAPGCGDGVLNNGESDIDCGGPACIGCLTGQVCTDGGDCFTGVCTGGTCQDPTCTDGVANGDETDVDCGGPTACPRCPDYDLCTDPTDCTTAACTMGRCGATGCIPFPGTSTDSYGYFGCTIPFANPADLPCPDISTSGTLVSLSDDSSATVPIGFTFDFYGNNYTNAYINSNGGVAFSGPWSSIGPGSCTAVPYSSGTTEYVSLLWDDLYPPAGPGVRYETRGSAPNRQFIVRYDVQGYFSTPSTGIFTMVAHETSNRIDVCYHDTDFMSTSYNQGAGARSGINHSGSSPTPPSGLQFSCNAANLTNGLMLQYIHP